MLCIISALFNARSTMNNSATTYNLQEWPTWLAIIGVYTLWWVVLISFESIPFASVFLVIVLAFHGSVQHELLHGHPSNNQNLNDFLAYPPLALWYPYPVYKRTHLVHHNNEDLTIPGVDPESYFLSEDRWNALSKWRQQLALFNMTLLGRLLLAPMHHFVGLKKQMIKSLKKPTSVNCRVWILHESLALILLLLVGLLFEVNIFIYNICAYFAQSVILLRSYYEHRVASEPNHRSIIMKASLPMRMVFLNNNYHAIHHEHPGMSWYHLDKEYNSKGDYYEKKNGGFVEQGYLKWLVKYAFKPVAHPKHLGF